MKTYKPKPYKFPFYITENIIPGSGTILYEFFIKDKRCYTFYNKEIWCNSGAGNYIVNFMCKFNGTLEKAKEFIYNDYKYRYEKV
jgi:hypothetical protein